MKNVHKRINFWKLMVVNPIETIQKQATLKENIPFPKLVLLFINGNYAPALESIRCF